MCIIWEFNLMISSFRTTFLATHLTITRKQINKSFRLALDLLVVRKGSVSENKKKLPEIGFWIAMKNASSSSLVSRQRFMSQQPNKKNDLLEKAMLSQKQLLQKNLSALLQYFEDSNTSPLQTASVTFVNDQASPKVHQAYEQMLKKLYETPKKDENRANSALKISQTSIKKKNPSFKESDFEKLAHLKQENAQRLLRINEPPTYQLFQTTVQKRDLPPVKLKRLKYIQLKEDKKQLNLQSPLCAILDSPDFSSTHRIKHLSPIKPFNISKCAYQQKSTQFAYNPQQQQDQEFNQGQSSKQQLINRKLKQQEEQIFLPLDQLADSTRNSHSKSPPHRSPAGSPRGSEDSSFKLKTDSSKQLNNYYAWALSVSNLTARSSRPSQKITQKNEIDHHTQIVMREINHSTQSSVEAAISHLKRDSIRPHRIKNETVPIKLLGNSCFIPSEKSTFIEDSSVTSIRGNSVKQISQKKLDIVLKPQLLTFQNPSISKRGKSLGKLPQKVLHAQPAHMNISFNP